MTESTTHRWALVTRRSGASPLVRIAAALLAERVRVAGFAQEPVEQDAERTGYELRRLESRERRPVARRATAEPADGECAFCSLYFDENAFAAAREWIREDAGHAEVLLIDGVSKLEAAGRGHAGALREALRHSSLVVLAVRPEQLFAIMERFDLPEPIATLEDTSDEALASFAAMVAAAVPRSALVA